MITLDLETRSLADLAKVGAWNYSIEHSTDIICMAWDAGDGVQAWIPGDPLPQYLCALMHNGVPVEAHNCAFEEALWENVMVPKYGFPPVAGDQWRDTMAVACYLALPARLDVLSKALLNEGKDPEGSRLISKYSKLYLPSAKKEIPEDDMEKWISYCKDDVEKERTISHFMGDLPERELKIFNLERKINRRGIFLDKEGIRSAMAVVNQRQQELAGEFREVTGLNPGQVAEVLKWAKERGVDLPNLQKDTVVEALDRTDLPPEVRDALDLRRRVAKASTKKLAAMDAVSFFDGRARNQTRYHGAATGRTIGSGFQPLNLAKSYENVDPEQLVTDIGRGNAELLDMLYGDAMEAVSKASRHWIMAEPPNQLFVADFSSIEAVVLACLAGEQWKIDAFARHEPIYERMGERIHNLPAGTVTKDTHPHERQDGKTGELACQYQGGIGAWRKFDKTDRHSDEAVGGFVRSWRGEHPAAVQMWEEYNDCAMQAVQSPKETFEYRDIMFYVEDWWLIIELLNGKKLHYFMPEVRLVMPGWHQPSKIEACNEGTCECKPRPSVTYMATKNGQWRRVATYGGKLTENICQATSREILEDKKLLLDGLGYDIVLSVYDEIVVEVGSRANIAEFLDVMLGRSGFYADWPINASAWQGVRYKK